MINRRMLLKRILPGVIAAPLMIPTLAAELSRTETPDDFRYRGWRVVWGHWQRLPNLDILGSRWIAYGGKHDRFHLCSCWPGRAGSFVPDAIFDISIQSWQSIPNLNSSEDDLQHYKSECLERLKRLIHKAGPPPLQEPVYLD